MLDVIMTIFVYLPALLFYIIGLYIWACAEDKKDQEWEEEDGK